MADLRSRTEDHAITAIDYKKGMRLDTGDGRTSVALSPDFLSRMAEDAALEEEYTGHLAAMRQIEGRQSAPQIEAQSWAVAKDGSIRHYALVADTVSREERRSLQQELQETGREAFRRRFWGCLR